MTLATSFLIFVPSGAGATDSAPGGVSALSGASGAQRLREPRVAGAEHCRSARLGLAFYVQRANDWRHKIGEGRVTVGSARANGTRLSCPYTLWRAQLWRTRSHRAHRAYERYAELHVLRDFRVAPGQNAWRKAIEEAQRPFPETRAWLLSCSAAEGGWGRFVYNSEGSGVYGPLQFQASTFARMSFAARIDVASRGFIVPASAASWHSALGQALAGAWGLVNGRRHEWFGSGCR